MNRWLILIVVCWRLLPIQYVFGDDNSAALKVLRHARVITCKFNKSAMTDFEDGELKLYQSSSEHEMVFDSIDFINGRARMVSTGAQIEAFITNSGATFFEGSRFDNHSFTTIFPIPSKAKGEFVAVQSSHSLKPGIKLKTGKHFYVPKQSYGSCKAHPSP